MKLETTDSGTSEYSVSDNFFEDFVEFSRSNVVQNEKQAMVVQMVIASGLLDDWRDFNSAIVTGSSSSGKSHMIREVIKASLEYAESAADDVFMYELTGGSDKAAIDDDEIDKATIAYLHEMNKIPDEFLEFIKSVSEDGGFKYGRNVADDDSPSGRTTAHIEKDPIPVLFAFADENEDASGDDQELRSRLVEVKVDENEEKNAAVHKSQWGAKRITLPSAAGEYMFEAPDVAHRVKSHMRDAPRNVNVVLPTDDGRFDGDDWHAGKVSSPLFNFKRSESTRASSYLASLLKGSAVLNYHSRRTWCDECGTERGPDESYDMDYECQCGGNLRLIAEPQDLGNLLDCRDVLLATTHNLTSKKFAIIDGIIANGSPATVFDSTSQQAVMATKNQIEDYIQAADDIATMSKHEIGSLLDELNEQLVIQKRDHPDDARKNVYVFDGASMFERPDIEAYYDRFEDVYSPVTGDSIESVVDEQLAQFNATLDTSIDSIESAADAMGSASDSEASSGTLSDYDSSSDPDASQLSEAAQTVREALHETLDGKTVPSHAREDIDMAHMIGVTPLQAKSPEETSVDVSSSADAEDVTEVYVPEREPSGADKEGSLLSPDEWDGIETFDATEQHVAEAVSELQAEGVFEIEERDDVIAFHVNQTS